MELTLEDWNRGEQEGTLNRHDLRNGYTLDSL